MRKYYLNARITREVEQALITFFDNSEQGESVIIFIDSLGGNSTATGNILNSMRRAQGRGVVIATIAIGDIGSGALLIFGEGNRGHRSMLPYFKGTIHLPEPEKDRDPLSEEEKKKIHILRQQFAQDIVDFSSNDMVTLKWVFENDKKSFSAKELVRLGMADSVLRLISTELCA